MLANLIIALLVLLPVFFVIVAFRPAAFRVTRNTAIMAPPLAVFNFVNDLHQFQEWSPWAKMDPNTKVTYQGPPAGVGAVFSWVGGRKVGSGRMTVTESRPGELVRYKLEFLKPFKAVNTAEFTFKNEGGQTLVAWSMFGKNNYLAKLFGVFVNCDKLIGGQFEKGLADLKTLSESSGGK